MKRLLFLLLLLPLCSQAAWLGAWKYRAPLTLTNGQGGALTNYPTQVSLTSGNFTFAQALSDCSDLRVTAPDGVTIIPYTITACNSGAQTATLWIKPVTIAGSGTYVPYLYWGNASPPAFDIPPAGPWAKYSGNPVLTSGSVDYLAENIVFDPVTNEYWMMMQGQYATSTDLLTWTPAAGGAGTSAGPSLLLNAGTWYQYSGGGSSITVATSSTVNGTFTGTGVNLISTQAATWKSTRVLEPYVFQDANGTWVMFYMGDTDNGSGEQVGYATASSPAGPWTDYASNPVLTFGAAATYDAGTVADPYVYQMSGTYYIFYACSPTTSAWNTCLATSTDLIAFTKVGLINWQGASGAWDSSVAFRGALIRVGNTYYASYTGQPSHYAVGIATQSAQSTAVGYPPFQIFGFYDDFSESSLDLSQWQPQDANGSATITSGILTVTSGVSTTHQLTTRFKFGTGTIAEFLAQRTALSSNNAGELGFSTPNIRLFDNGTTSSFWNLNNNGTGASSTLHPDTSYHTQSVWRKTSAESDFKPDAAASWQAVTTGATSTVPMGAWLEPFGAGGQNTSFNLDWVRVRQYSEPEPTAAFGTVQILSTANSLMSLSIP